MQRTECETPTPKRYLIKRKRPSNECYFRCAYRDRTVVVVDRAAERVREFLKPMRET